MTPEELKQKQAQFNEFFSIEDQFSVNITKCDPTRIGNFQWFLDKIPAPFKMASEIATIDQAALKPIQALSGIAGQLVDFLNFQAKKIDLMMSYIVQQQDEKDKRFEGVSFGGGGFTFLSQSPMQVGDMLEVKLFITTDNCAVFCFGEVIECSSEPTSEEAVYRNQVIYHYIQDEDRDMLVRASLHKQTKQLKKLAEQRRNDQSS